jgi:hypothetical protein
MPEPTLKEAEQYYKKNQRGKLADKVIMHELKGNDEVVYGARSVNAVLPAYLRKHTEDWDIFTEDDPQVVATKIEKALDKRYGGDYFYVIPAKHEGTYKVKSRVTKRDVADVSIKEDNITKKKVGGINYMPLDYQVGKLKAALSHEESKFRHDRDMETLQRIEIFTNVQKKKTVKRAKRSPLVSLRTIGRVDNKYLLSIGKMR